jgi:putative phosphoribosyl transferase
MVQMTDNIHFANRTEAGRYLAKRLLGRKGAAAVVYALPRGGVPVALEIARELDAPLDLALVRKIGAPGYPEFALAAVSDGKAPRVVINESVLQKTGASRDYLLREAAKELKEIERRRTLYFGNRDRPDPAGKTAIVVDDGLATGATARVAVEALRQQGAAKVILAVPVAPRGAATEIRAMVDDFVCVLEPELFSSVGSFYDDFHQLTDEEVIAMLDEAAAFGSAKV